MKEHTKTRPGRRIGMAPEESENVSRLLQAIQAGDQGAEDELFRVVYDELRRLAHSRMRREPAGHTLQTTALVHEAYLRLVKDEKQPFANRPYFFRAAAEAMRRILVERARKYRGLKHGGGRRRIPYPVELAVDPPSPDILILDTALARLEQQDPRKSEVVKLHYFVGLTVEETAALLGIASRTVDKDWKLAKAWLRREIGSETNLRSDA